MHSGQFLAIASAALFGVSPVFCKLLIGGMSPALLAGLLYLGSGIGLELYFYLKGGNSLAELSTLGSGIRLKLLGAIACGGIVAPLFLTYGIRYGTASEVTLLLNLESVATTVISWLIFKEHVGAAVWGGKIVILMGAAIIVTFSQGAISLSLPGLLVVLACIFWGIDNNLTREVLELSAVNLAGIKGLTAGAVNIILALLFTSGAASPGQIAGSLAIGAVSYGLSLVLFIHALRSIGAARTATFFATGPFIGTLLSVSLMGERPPFSYWLAAAMMITGIILLYRERHGHFHTHEPITHSHHHLHDDHHSHEHTDELAKESHQHHHVHTQFTHKHIHWPDIHHRHGHGEGNGNERSTEGEDDRD